MNRSAQRWLEPVALSALIAAIQIGCFAGLMYYTQLDDREQSDSEFGHWHLEAQLFWISALLITSLVLIYMALRRLRVRYAGALVLPVMTVEFAVGAYIASKLSGPVDLRAGVLAAVLSAELVGLTSVPGLLPVGLGSVGSGDDRPAPSLRHERGFAGLWVEPIGIGLLIDAIQFALLIGLQFWGVYGLPQNVLHPGIDRQVIWFALVVGAPSIAMMYIALKHLDVRVAGWLVVPAVLLQFGLVAVVESNADGLGRMQAVLIAAILPAELVSLSLCLGDRSTRPT